MSARRLLMVLFFPLAFFAMSGVLNGTVRSANEGRMPVAGDARYEGQVLDERHVVMGGHTKFALLADTMLIGDDWYSVGDVFYYAGIIMVIFVVLIVFGTMCGRYLKWRRADGRYPLVEFHHHGRP